MKIIRIALAAPLALAATLAQADNDYYRLDPAYVQECGSCHVAYPPALLPPESWQRLLGGLDKHYGSDASLDAAAQKSIADWVLASAGSGKRARSAPPQDRITLGRWFIREHREVPRAAWTSPAVKSAANCGACHEGAATGDYDDDRVRIPR